MRRAEAVSDFSDIELDPDAPGRRQRGRPQGHTELLRQAIGRDGEAMQQVVRWYLPLMSNVAIDTLAKGRNGLGLEKRKELARLVIQTMQFAAFEHADEQTLTHYTNFLVATVRNVTMNTVRTDEKDSVAFIGRRGALETLARAASDPGDDPAAQAAAHEALRQISRFIYEGLPERIRPAAIASWVDELPERAIAEKLGISPASVNLHLELAAEKVMLRFGELIDAIAPKAAEEWRSRTDEKREVRETREERKERRRRERRQGQEES